jgi:hypothetical protein
MSQNIVPSVFLQKIVLAKMQSATRDAHHIDNENRPKIATNTPLGRTTIESAPVDFSKKNQESSAAMVKIFYSFDKDSIDYFNILRNYNGLDFLRFFKIFFVLSDSGEMSSVLDFETAQANASNDNWKSIEINELFSAEGKFSKSSVNFTLSKGITRYLSCFVRTYIDIESLCAAFGLDRSVMDEEIFRGNTIFEKIVGNYEIVSDITRDLGVKDKISKYIADFSPSDTNVGSYFTDIYLSRDYSDDIRAIFGIDFLTLAREKTLFGNYYLDDKELAKNAKIKSLKIKKIRISEESAISRGLFRKNIFSDISVENMVAIFGTSRETLSDSKFSEVEEVQIFITNDNYRFFMFSDVVDGEEMSGKYQYGVDLVLDDKTKISLQEKLDYLSRIYTIFQEYYNLARISGEYNLLEESFSDEFIADQISKYTDVLMAPWNQALAIYMKILSFISSELNLEEITTKLALLINPLSGSLEGAEIFLSLIGSLMNKFKVILGSSETTSTSPSNYNGRAGSGRGSSPAALISYYFSSLLDCTYLRQRGYDVLGVGGDIEGKKGLREITKEELSERFEKETQKYFTSNSPTLNFSKIGKQNLVSLSADEAKYSYLTLASTVFDQQIVDFLGNSSTIEQKRKAYIDLAQSNANTSPARVNDKNILESENVTVEIRSGATQMASTVRMKDIIEQSNLSVQENKIQENVSKNIQEVESTKQENEASFISAPLLVANRNGREINTTSRLASFNVNADNNILDTLSSKKVLTRK